MKGRFLYVFIVSNSDRDFGAISKLQFTGKIARSNFWTLRIQHYRDGVGNFSIQRPNRFNNLSSSFVVTMWHI